MGASPLERVMGIEPTYSAWEADVLPLNYTRVEWGILRQPRNGRLRCRQAPAFPCGAWGSAMPVTRAAAHPCAKTAQPLIGERLLLRRERRVQLFHFLHHRL